MRPKRQHQDPYGALLRQYIEDGDALIQEFGGTPEPHPEPVPYEPDEFEVNTCRFVLEEVGRQYGSDFLTAALIAAGIEDGQMIEDDFDLFLYSDVLVYVREHKGEGDEQKILDQLNSQNF